MSNKNYNAYETAQAQFDRVAEIIGLDEPIRQLLRQPMREYHMLIPVRMDDGNVKVFQGFRVQHNDARGPAKEVSVFIRRKPLIPSGRFQCG